MRRSVPLMGIAMVTACGQLIGVQELDTAGEGPPDADLPDAGVEPDVRVPPKRVFVTSDSFDGMMGGISGADARCSAAAARGNLSGGPWIAWISGVGMNGIDRIKDEGPYVLLDGRLVVSNKNQLVSGALSSPINITETGQLASGVLHVWTGTLSSGKASNNCENWSTNSPIVLGLVGALDRADQWTQISGAGPYVEKQSCQMLLHLYCFEL